MTDTGSAAGSPAGSVVPISGGVITGNGSSEGPIPTGRIGGSWSVVPGTTMGVGVIAGSTIGGGGVIVGVGVIRDPAGCSVCGCSTGVVAGGDWSRTNPWAGMFAVVMFQLVTARWPWGGT